MNITSRFRESVVSLVLLGALLGGCQPGPQGASVGSETIWQTTQPYAEIASAVIPQGSNPACPQGKAFIVAAISDFPSILSADLAQSGQTVNVTALPASSFAIGANDKFGSADILIEALPDGSLLVVLQGGTVAPITPEPAWWHVYSKDPKTDPAWTDGHRGALHLWRSSDCGTSWDRLPDIDSASPAIFSGQCGIPQADKQGAPRRGGFDRGGWIAPYGHEEVWRFITSVFERADALLLGRRTWEIWAAYWPHHDGGDPVSHGINVLPKLKVSLRA